MSATAEPESTAMRQWKSALGIGSRRSGESAALRIDVGGSETVPPTATAECRVARESHAGDRAWAPAPLLREVLRPPPLPLGLELLGPSLAPFGASGSGRTVC